MPKQEQTTEEKIEEAINEVRTAMMENVKASRLVIDATVAKQKSKYKLQKAKERLGSLEQELMEL